MTIILLLVVLLNLRVPTIETYSEVYCETNFGSYSYGNSYQTSSTGHCCWASWQELCGITCHEIICLNNQLLGPGATFNSDGYSCCVSTAVPTENPTSITSPPTDSPSNFPTQIPTVIPTKMPTNFPTLIPTKIPSQSPSETYIPTNNPFIPPINTNYANNTTNNVLEEVDIIFMLLISLLIAGCILLIIIVLYIKRKKKENKLIYNNNDILKQVELTSNSVTNINQTPDPNNDNIIIDNDIDPVNCVDKVSDHEEGNVHYFKDDIVIDGNTKGGNMDYAENVITIDKELLSVEYDQVIVGDNDEDTINFLNTKTLKTPNDVVDTFGQDEFEVCDETITGDDDIGI